MNQSALVIAVSALFLAGCGGGGSSDQLSPPPAPKPSTLADCYGVTPGVKFTMTDGSSWSMVQEMFEGALAHGRVRLNASGKREAVSYESANGALMLGVILYNSSGFPDMKSVFSNVTPSPLSMVPGQTSTVNFSYTATNTLPVYDGNGQPTGASQTTTSTENSVDTVTFVGFENVTLAGRTFVNACKLTSPSETAGRTSVGWVAKGFAAIAHEERDARGALVPGSRVEVASVTAAP